MVERGDLFRRSPGTDGWWWIKQEVFTLGDAEARQAPWQWCALGSCMEVHSPDTIRRNPKGTPCRRTGKGFHLKNEDELGACQGDILIYMHTPRGLVAAVR